MKIKMFKLSAVEIGFSFVFRDLLTMEKMIIKLNFTKTNSKFLQNKTIQNFNQQNEDSLQWIRFF